ncbi:hypothetical protein ACLMAL_13745 [Nocardia sp. CWNU-33]|uniref:hypothetical protein n=1 Tax=Nocardia sp. CWNU-33 TaxID=3392117 RepID=UPI00398EC827
MTDAAGWLAKTGAVPIGYYKDEEKTGRLFKTVDGTRVVVTDDRARAEREGSVTLIGSGNRAFDVVYLREQPGHDNENVF